VQEILICRMYGLVFTNVQRKQTRTTQYSFNHLITLFAYDNYSSLSILSSCKLLHRYIKLLLLINQKSAQNHVFFLQIQINASCLTNSKFSQKNSQQHQHQGPGILKRSRHPSANNNSDVA